MADDAPPFLHHPTLKADDAEKNGLLCFKDKMRECGADCMAWIIPPDGEEYQDQQWAHCRLLVDSFRVGKHSVITATQLVAMTKLQKDTAADRLRATQPAPPRVGGPRL